MSKEELKMKFPQTYNAIVQEGVMQERKRLESIAQKNNEQAKAWDF